MRQSSEDREDFAGAFSPERPSLPPPGGPAGPDPGQRRFDRIFAGVAALVVLALIGGLVIYFNTQSHPKPAVVTSDPKKDVEQAYLAYSAALNESLLKLDVGPVAPYLTSNQLKYEQQVIAYDAQQKAQYSAIDEHDLRTVVYSGGVTASVDDNLVEHRTPVIPGTLAHAGPEQLQAFHVSIVLVNQNRHWLIDSEVSFGSTDASSQDGVSYAALSRTKPLDDRSRSSIEAAYLSYWQVYLKAFETQDATGLPDVSVDPALSRDTTALQADGLSGRTFAGSVEHNYRIAEKDPSTAYVYDTYLDDTHPSGSSNASPGSGVPTPLIRHQTFELLDVGGRWKVDLVKADQ